MGTRKYYANMGPEQLCRNAASITSRTPRTRVRLIFISHGRSTVWNVSILPQRAIENATAGSSPGQPEGRRGSLFEPSAEIHAELPEMREAGLERDGGDGDVGLPLLQQLHRPIQAGPLQKLLGSAAPAQPEPTTIPENTRKRLTSYLS